MNELMKIESTELEKVVKESGLAIQEGEEIKQSYQPFIVQLAEIQSQASKINFESPTLLDEEIAGKLRKQTMKIRTGAEAIKDSRKKIHLLKGNLEQAAYNLIAASCKLTEEEFGNVEKRREIVEKARKEALKAERIERLSPYGIDSTYYDLSNMPEDVFENLLLNAKTALENKIAAEKKAEEERLAKIEADRIENERIRKENERLQEEAKERERLAEIERKKQADILKVQQEKANNERREQEAKFEAERKEKQRIENELKAKIESENKAKQVEQERLIAEEKQRRDAERKAKSAPDKEKLLLLVSKISTIEMPELKSDEAIIILDSVKQLLMKVNTYIKEKVSEL